MKNITISRRDLAYADRVLPRLSQPVPVRMKVIGDCITYEVMEFEPQTRPGRTTYWTSASGAITEITYLGVMQVHLTD